MFDSVDAVAAGLKGQGYITGRDVATQVYLAARLGKPLLVEGPSGSGRAALARAVAAASGMQCEVVRCHAGIDVEGTAYTWDIDRQALHVREAQEAGRSAERARTEAFSAQFLRPGPILRAFHHPERALLVFTELEQAPAAFQIWLNTVLEASSLDVPPLGDVPAAHPPLVICTTNRGDTIEPAFLHRCIAVSLAFPSFEGEVEILLRHVPGLARPLAAQIANFLGSLRQQPLQLRPGLGESLDWARALVALRASGLNREIVDQTLGCFLKDPRDIEAFRTRKVSASLGNSINRVG